nr:hypothetical protein [Candidatus Sigynarchaeum springense]
MADLFHSIPWTDFMTGANTAGIVACVVASIAFAEIGWILAK